MKSKRSKVFLFFMLIAIMLNAQLAFAASQIDFKGCRYPSSSFNRPLTDRYFFNLYFGYPIFHQSTHFTLNLTYESLDLAATMFSSYKRYNGSLTNPITLYAPTVSSIYGYDVAYFKYSQYFASEINAMIRLSRDISFWLLPS